jgi:hypothetical protein
VGGLGADVRERSTVDKRALDAGDGAGEAGAKGVVVRAGADVLDATRRMKIGPAIEHTTSV